MHKGLQRDLCLAIVGITKDQFYYNQQGTRPGPLPSLITKWRDPNSLINYEVDNLWVIQKIVEIKLDPDQANGYRLISLRLKILGFYINHKKVYRLMKEHHLLEQAIKSVGRKFVKYRRVCPSKPLETLEMDIKYVWVHDKRRYAYILTVIDTFTRYVLDWSVGYSMRSEQVKAVWERLIANHLQILRQKEASINIEVRTDNGKQFCSATILQFFRDNELNQVFTHPYTPEENGHIESFHKTLGKSLENNYFSSLLSVENRLKKFYKTYNNIRSHGSILGLSPSKFWTLFEKNKIEVIPLEKRRQKFKLKIAYQDVLTMSNIDKYDIG